MNSSVSIGHVPSVWWVIILSAIMAVGSVRASDSPDSPHEPAVRTDFAPAGFVEHSIVSDFQAGETRVYVLLPEAAKSALSAGETNRFPVIYLLPVEAGTGVQWGNPMIEAARLNLANRLSAILAYPTFSALPWYLDHPDTQTLKQETYFIRDVLPKVESTYPARRDRDGRWLLGFSKSGWGAVRLLVRHPDLFGRAAAWDAPLMMDEPRYGVNEIAGSKENFVTNRIEHLLRTGSHLLGGATSPRFLLTGYDNFRDQMRRAHALFEELKIPHEYRDGPQRKHHWNSGWVEETAQWLTGYDPTNNVAADPATWLAEISRLMDRKWPANRTINIVCHGHSVPAGYFKTPKVDTFNAYPHLLHLGLKERHSHAVINVIVTAIGGEDSAKGAKRFETEVLSHRPDVLLIDYGLNDRRIGLEAARQAWAEIIEKANLRGAKVILLTPTPDVAARLDDSQDPLNLHAEQIRNLAARYGVGLVDSLSAFKEAIRHGTRLDELMSQSNHPNRRGHKLVADEIMKWFRK